MLSEFIEERCSDFCPDFKFKFCEYYDPTSNPQECGFCKKIGRYRCIAHRGQIPLSHSTVQNFLTCHHLCYLQAFRGIQTRDEAKSPPLKMGALWDAVLTKHYGGINRETGKPYNIPALIQKYEIGTREVAKVRSLYRAYKLLEIEIEPDYELQAKISMVIPFNKVWGDNTPVEVLVTGYYDRKYDDHFVENKLSGRPDFYTDPWFIQSQVGTYFLADPKLQSCTMEIARVPDLKSTKSYKDETDDEYAERCYQDILSRPSYYFLGYDVKTHKYGKKFFRTEFDLEELKNRYLHILREYWEARELNGWYKNDKSCMNVLPGIQCDMLDVCRYNNMSETQYKIRERPITF
jgi:hypothetical protein